MDRKTFLKKSAGVLLISLPVVSLIGCSTSDDGGGTPPPNQNPTADCGTNGTISSIGTNHGHTLIVSKEDVMAGAAKTYSIQGTSLHDHTVTLTAANFTSLRSNSGISITSTSDDSHTHSVAVSCA